MKIKGTSGNDDLNGTDKNDAIYGYDGNDVIHPGGGADRVYGGAGDDTVILDTVSSGEAHSLLDGGSGVDTLDYSVAASPLVWTYSSDTQLFSVADVDFRNMEALIGGSGSNAFNLSNSVVGLTISGGSADDSFDLGGGDDVLHGGDGNDQINGGYGHNALYGENGNDTFYLEGGTGSVDGGIGVNTIFVFSDANLLTGVAGSFGFNYQVQNIENVVAGGATEVDVVGSKAANMISVWSIFAGQSAAVFDGGAGDDTLVGGNLNDVLTGGRGDDVLTGGSGADRFVFNPGDASASSTHGDVITDFSSADKDQIDLSALDANTLASGDQAFHFIGDHPFSGRAGELREQAVVGGHEISGDVNGDGKADFFILVLGHTQLHASDFVL